MYTEFWHLEVTISAISWQLLANYLKLYTNLNSYNMHLLPSIGRNLSTVDYCENKIVGGD
jgi:hypothetical protein